MSNQGKEDAERERAREERKLRMKKRAHVKAQKAKASQKRRQYMDKMLGIGDKPGRPKEDYEEGTPMLGYGKKKIKRQRAKG